MSKKITKEQIEYIINNYGKQNERDMADTLDLTLRQVRRTIYNNNLNKNEYGIIQRSDSKLTPQEKCFVLENYSHMSTIEISKILNVSRDDVAIFAQRHKLKKASDKYKDNGTFTLSEKQFIIDNYADMTTREMGRLLNSSLSKIYSYARTHNLTKSKNYIEFRQRDEGLTLKQKEFILSNYSDMQSNKICKKLNITYEQLRSFASNHNLRKSVQGHNNPHHYYEELLKKRKDKTNYNVFDFINNSEEIKLPLDLLYKSKYGKYCVNSNYFNKIDNEFKAYWLGFLYADGCVTIKKPNGKKSFVLSLALAIKDEEHIKKFRSSIQSDAPIKSRNIRDDFYSSYINICNRTIVEDLNNLGCVPCKSLKLKFPTKDTVPIKYLRDFIRGYFDGDGCIHINTQKREVGISFVGTYEFLKDLQNVMCNELDISHVKIYKKENQQAYACGWGSVRSCEKIYKYLYRDCNIYLDRKLKKFDILYCLD